MPAMQFYEIEADQHLIVSILSLLSIGLGKKSFYKVGKDFFSDPYILFLKNWQLYHLIEQRFSFKNMYF